jgi:preprotein translocase subunit SecG
MIEAANVLGVLAAVLLVLAVVAWALLIRGPLMQRTDGRTGMDSAQGELASELLFWAAGLSSAALFLAIAGWIFA